MRQLAIMKVLMSIALVVIKDRPGGPTQWPIKKWLQLYQLQADCIKRPKRIREQQCCTKMQTNLVILVLTAAVLGASVVDNVEGGELISILIWSNTSTSSTPWFDINSRQISVHVCINLNLTLKLESDVWSHHHNHCMIMYYTLNMQDLFHSIVTGTLMETTTSTPQTSMRSEQQSPIHGVDMATYLRVYSATYTPHRWQERCLYIATTMEPPMTISILPIPMKSGPLFPGCLDNMVTQVKE